MASNQFQIRIWDNKNKHWIKAQDAANLGLVGELPDSSRLMFLYDDNWIVDRCTGLTDKNGELIFERDIVEWKPASHTIKAVVKWRNGGFYTEVLAGEISQGGKAQLPDNYQYVEKAFVVIGNVHEDDELLS